VRRSTDITVNVDIGYERKAHGGFCHWTARYITCGEVQPEKNNMDVVEMFVSSLSIAKNRRAMSSLTRHARASTTCTTV
jgi:hypothetical protein